MTLSLSDVVEDKTADIEPPEEHFNDRFQRLQYENMDENQSVDVLLPADSAADKTVWLIYIHGGSWRDQRMTCVSAHDLMAHCYDSTKGKIGCAAPNYRLSQTAQHPAPLEDCISFFAFLRQNFNASEFVIVGHSAGAFLALQLWSLWTHGLLKSTEANGDIYCNIHSLVLLGAILDMPDLTKEFIRNSHESFLDFVREEFVPKDLWSHPPLNVEIMCLLRAASPLSAKQPSDLLLNGTDVLKVEQENPDLSKEEPCIEQHSRPAKPHLYLLWSSEDGLLSYDHQTVLKRAIAGYSEPPFASYTETNIKGHHYMMPWSFALKKIALESINRAFEQVS